MSSPVPASPHFIEAVQQLTDTRPPQAAQAIYSSNGIKLVERGVAVDSGLYERLLQHQLATPLQDALQAQDSVTGKSLRAAAEDLLERRAFLAYMLEKPAARALALDAIEAQRLPPPIAFHLSVLRDVYPALFSFSLCSALVAGWLAATSHDALRYDAVMLSAGGLLQDIGMMHLDPALLQPSGPLTPEQRRQLHSHPLVSGVLLERHHEYPRELIRAVREHHETLDGSGYPAGLPGDKISPWGKVLGLSQVTAALLRPGRGHSTHRLSMLLRTTRQYDAALAERLLTVVLRLIDADVPPSPTEMASLEPVNDPVPHLIAMDQLLAAWPDALGPEADLPASCRPGMAVVGDQCRQMRRVLADAGANAEQLVLLGSAQADEVLNTELSLIARELAWQMRTLAAQVPQRWGARAGEVLPAALQDWSTRVEQRCGGLLAG